MQTQAKGGFGGMFSTEQVRPVLGASLLLACGVVLAPTAMATDNDHTNTNGTAPIAAAAPAAAAPVPAASSAAVSTTTLDNVTVTGQADYLKMLTGQAQIPESTRTQTTVTQAQIQDATAPVQDFAAALTNQPNFVRSHTGSNDSGSTYRLRGFDQNHLGLLIDGIPVNSSDDGSVYTNDITNNYAISSIDVMPGAGSASTMGLSNFGGTIAIHTKDPQPDFYIQPYLGVGSFHAKQYGAQVNTGSFLDDSTSAILSLSARDGDGYYDHTNTKYRNDATFKSISKLPLGKLTLYFHSTDQSYNYYRGITDAEKAQYGKRYNGYNENPDSIEYFGYNYNKFYNNRTYIKYEINRDNIHVSNQLYYYYARGYGASATSSDNNELYQVKSRHNEDRVGNIFRFAYDMKYATFRTGVYWSYQDTLHRADRTPIETKQGKGPPLGPEYSETVKNSTEQPYVEVEIRPFKHFTITPGLKYARIDRDFYNNLAGTHQAVSYNRLLPSLGLNYQLLEGWNVYGNYTRSFKPPGYNQFYSGHFNTNLAPEEADSYEVGTIWDKGPWSGRLTLFETHYLSYIRSESFGKGSTSYSQLVNAGGRVNQGVELENSYAFNGWLSGFANIGYLNAYYSDHAQPPEQSPRNTDALGLRVKYKGWSGGISGQYVSSYYVGLYDNQFYKIKDHVETKAYAKYDFPDAMAKNMGVKKMSVSVNLDNLLNNQYVVDAGQGPDNPRKKYAEPFNVFAGLYVRF
ncbi:TonB-dependent receptor [Salinisphaera hydrothermalis]|uniref:TonB-dependent receptor n=1 Tax=Salinisphaera hydrothermalis TaxID=563188 RepID=UPI00333E986B